MRRHLRTDSLLQDMGTNSGEFLLAPGHELRLTGVAEGCASSLALYMERMAPLGFAVRAVGEDDGCFSRTIALTSSSTAAVFSFT